MNDWTLLEQYLAKASAGPWIVVQEGDEIFVRSESGSDVTGLAFPSDAQGDYAFIAEARNKVGGILEENEKFFSLLLQHKVCPECGHRMNRQLYCVKCDSEWSRQES